MSRYAKADTDSMLRFAHELTTRLGGAVKDMVPAEAQWHLLNAQRELLTALFLIYEHQAQVRRTGRAGSEPEWDEYPAEPRPRRRTTAAAGTANGAADGGPRKAPARKRRPAAAAPSPRLSKIDIE